MSESPISSAREFVQADMVLPQHSLEAEQAILAAAEGCDGIESVTIADGKATVCYDPVKITHVELEALIAKAEGTPPKEVDVQRASPLADLGIPPPEPYFPSGEAGRE